ncbi:MAG: hypothetical protein OXE92_08185 [Bacteroidetes bacterium]|nr:hypothetical protein [Bacteroidota bacterium]
MTIILKQQKTKFAKLADIADIRIGIQALAGKVFILEVVNWEGEFVIVKSGERHFSIEKSSQVNPKIIYFEGGKRQGESGYILPLR